MSGIWLCMLSWSARMSWRGSREYSDRTTKGDEFESSSTIVGTRASGFRSTTQARGHFSHIRRREVSNSQMLGHNHQLDWAATQSLRVLSKYGVTAEKVPVSPTEDHMRSVDEPPWLHDTVSHQPKRDVAAAGRHHRRTQLRPLRNLVTRKKFSYHDQHIKELKEKCQVVRSVANMFHFRPSDQTKGYLTTRKKSNAKHW